MTRKSTLLATVAAGTLFAGGALAQENQDMAEADEAAEDMMTAVYVYDTVDYLLPSDVMNRLQSLGYSNFEDFDVEYGAYEVEATTPDGDEVEIEIDPISGAILDVDEDWL